MLKIHQPYKYLLVIGTLFVSGALLVGYSTQINTSSSSVHAAEDFSTEYRTISDITYMQDMNQQICSNTETPAANSPTSAYPTATLLDKRDNEYYTIVKLEDGNCWMQQNLRLKGATNLVDPQGKGYLTPEDSDVTGRWQLPATLNGSGNSVSGWTDDNNKPYSAYFSNTTNGVYYNWTAAIAMSDSSSKTSGDVNTSICPRGWKLPTNAEYSNMLTSEGIANSSAGSTKIRGTPYNYVYAGNVGEGTLGNAGSRGYYWSRTADSASNAYLLNFGSRYVVVDNSGRYVGYSVRCVAAGGLEPNEAPAIPPSSKNGNITVNVTPTITLDISDGVTATAEADKIATGTIEATVTSNSDYDVLLSTTEPKLIGKENSKNYIPPTSDTNPVQPGNDAWGILNKSGLYDPITRTPSSFHNTESTGNNSKTHVFNVGISISSSLPADTYATEVTVTAATK